LEAVADPRDGFSSRRNETQRINMPPIEVITPAIRQASSRGLSLTPSQDEMASSITLTLEIR